MSAWQPGPRHTRSGQPFLPCCRSRPVPMRNSGIWGTRRVAHGAEHATGHVRPLTLAFSVRGIPLAHACKRHSDCHAAGHLEVPGSLNRISDAWHGKPRGLGFGGRAGSGASGTRSRRGRNSAGPCGCSARADQPLPRPPQSQSPPQPRRRSAAGDSRLIQGPRACHPPKSQAGRGGRMICFRSPAMKAFDAIRNPTGSIPAPMPVWRGIDIVRRSPGRDRCYFL
jgi:hypothetical protein